MVGPPPDCDGVSVNEYKVINFRVFVGLCLKTAVPKAIEKADVIVFCITAMVGGIVFFVPSTERELTHWGYMIPVIAIVSVTLFRLFMSPFWVYRERDLEAQNNEAALRLAINERNEALENITRKPPKTAAEQHDYDTAKAALELTKEKGKIALRYLRSQGSLLFGTYNPSLPSGLTAQDALWVYNHCVSVGVVTQGGNARMGERTYSISPKMEKALDELLYEV